MSGHLSLSLALSVCLSAAPTIQVSTSADLHGHHTLGPSSHAVHFHADTYFRVRFRNGRSYLQEGAESDPASGRARDDAGSSTYRFSSVHDV